MEYYNLCVRRGETLSQTIRFKKEDMSVEDLTGRSGHCQIRDMPEGRLYAETEIRMIPEEGEVTIYLSAENTLAMTPGLYAYDFYLKTDGTGEVRYYLGGQFTILPSVTKPEE